MFKVFRKRKKETAAKPATSDSIPESPPSAKKTTTESSKKNDVPAVDPARTPEELCGITPAMDREKIREHLAMLFRRHNRAASSLDDKLRTEAELMLDAIVAVRERHLG